MPFFLMLLSFLFTVTAYAEASSSNAEAIPTVPVKVLQNRYFLKALRPEISLFGGTVLNEAYSTTYAAGARAGMFLTEYFGIDYAFTRFISLDSADLKAIRSIEYCSDVTCDQKKSLEPSFVRLSNSHSLLLTFAPIYSKTSLFSSYILYSDIYFSAGGAYLKTTQGSKPAAVLGVGQRFYFAKSFNVRVDAWDNIFTEERDNLGVTKKSTRHSWLISLGLSAFLRDGPEGG